MDIHIFAILLLFSPVMLGIADKIDSLLKERKDA